MLRRLYHTQPESFAFTPANQAWAEAQISKYPEGRQASAVIPLLWRAQEQEGWVSRPAIEHVAGMLDMAQIRVLEVASFYFMFQLQPVGSVAHIQICGTTSCMICGAEDLIGVCREKIADAPHELSADGKFSWEEVECLGACANAPMAQIGKDYYEDLTAERFAEMLDELAAGQVPTPGPQNGRYASEPKSGLTTLKEFDSGQTKYNASVQLATDIGDTIKRIDGSEVPLLTPWRDKGANHAPATPGAAVPGTETEGKAADASKPESTKANAPGKAAKGKAEAAEAQKAAPAGEGKANEKEAAPGAAKAGKAKAQAGKATAAEDTPKAAAKGKTPAKAKANVKPEGADADAAERAPEVLAGPRDGQADDLKQLKGVGPKLEQTLNELGFYHFDQVASWTAKEIAWVDSRLKFKGRIERDGWVDQAKQLAAGGETEFSKRVQDKKIYD